MSTPTEAPDAPVIEIGWQFVTIRCPYCNGRHQHERRTMNPGQRTRRGPGCGLRTNPEARTTGYWITLPNNRQETSP